METLTLFINDLYSADLGVSSYQLIENKTIENNNYEELTFSGSLLKEVVFQNITFKNCIFFGTNLDNCLFIDCHFINCKFQFSKFSDCNFESTTWQNCIWGLTAVKDSSIEFTKSSNNYVFESTGNFVETQTLNLADFLELTA